VTDALNIGDLTFALRRSPRRKTVSLTIDRDGSLTVSVPADCCLDRVEEAASKKLLWVYTKLAERELLRRPSTPKEFVNGEGFSYLGRSYRLLLVDTPRERPAQPLRLHQGRFMLQREESSRGQEHFVRWHTQHGQSWLARRVAVYADRVGVVLRAIVVKELGYRWGSCSRSGRLHFHWRVMALPPRIIDYVVVHELVHLCEPHHKPEFWRRLERAMPDHAARKQWLAEHGGEL